MALKHNIIANYIGRVYLIVIGIVMVPFYLHYLGAEAYGLVGFNALIDGWMIMLDLGLSPTISREVSKTLATNKPKEKENFKYLFHSVEFIFIILSITAIASIVLGSNWITNSWLNVEKLDKNSVSYAISLIGIMVGLRFLSILYKSGITASEEQVWYNKANITLSSLRYIGAFLLIKYISNDFKHFFEYLLAIVVLEFIVYSFKFYSIMNIGGFRLYFSLEKIKPIIKFAISIGYTGGIWIFITQLDKLLLSNILPLKEFGYFTIVAIIANAVIQISEPIHYAILPRLTALYSQKKMQELFKTYKNATLLLAIVAFSVGGVVSIYSYQLLYSWTGDIEASKWGKDILFWYVLANSLLALTTLQVYLQIAYGKLKLNVIYHTIALFLYSPLVFIVAYNYSVVNIAQLWFSFVLLTFIVWMPIVHKTFAPKIHKEWLFKIILPIFISTSTYLWILNSLNLDFSQNRAILFATLLLIGAGLLAVNYLISRVFYSLK